MTAVGVVWIAIMTAICVIGIELSARTQVGLLGAEIITLALFAVVALVKVATGNAGPQRGRPEPLAGSTRSRSTRFDALISGVLIAVFIYWGWDSTVTVNEESKDSDRGPGQGGAAGDGDPARDLRDRRRSRRRPTRRRRQLIDNADDVLSVLGERGVRLAAGQDPDHRRAHLGGRVDADDDPADRAHVAVDGARAARCRRRSATSTRAT